MQRQKTLEEQKDELLNVAKYDVGRSVVEIVEGRPAELT